MFRFVIGSFGLWLLAGGFAAALVDGMKSIAASELLLTTVGAAWKDLAPTGFDNAAAAVERLLGGVGRDGFVVVAGHLPLCIGLAGLGLVLIGLGRRGARSVLSAND